MTRTSFNAGSGPPSSRFVARVANLDCERDAGRLERSLRPAAGILQVTAHPGGGRVEVDYDPRTITHEAVAALLREAGFPPATASGRPAAPRPWRNPKVIASVASGVLLLAGWLLEGARAPQPVATALILASLITGGYFFGREAIEDLLFERTVGIELLMAIAAVVATVMGAAEEGAMLAFLYSISEAAEGYTEAKTRSAVRALMDLAPKTALVLRGGHEERVPVEQLVVEDVFVVKPGEAVATDGKVLVGSSSVNQAPVTGESVPVEKHPGDTVFAGSLNGEGALEVRATKAFAENTISRIIALVEEAQERKGASQRFIERFGRRYSPAVLAAAILVALIPPLVTGAPWSTWVLRATVFLVAAAPCALVISIPVTLVAALGTGARHGVLVKGGLYMEELARVSVVALDKTGTITRGVPEVTDVVPLPPAAGQRARSVEGILASAASVESRSQHPLALAMLRHAAAAGITATPAAEFRSLTGAGASGRVGDAMVFVGSPELFEETLGINLAAAGAQIARLQEAGKTVIVVGDQQGAWALVAIRDNVRLNAAAAIRALHEAGVRKVVMLSGDNARTAAAIAREVGIAEVHAGLKPEEKVARVRALSAEHGHVAMVGDGVNDAPALAEATVGVAMGTAGTDVALETADVALMADDLEKLVYALRLAKRSQRVVRQNLALSVLVIGVLVVGAVSGAFTLPVAVIGHELSEFVVIASGLRMLRG